MIVLLGYEREWEQARERGRSMDGIEEIRETVAEHDAEGTVPAEDAGLEWAHILLAAVDTLTAERDALRDYVNSVLSPTLTDDERKQVEILAAADGPVEQPFTDERRGRLKELMQPVLLLSQTVVRPTTIMRLILEVDALKARVEELEGRRCCTCRHWRVVSGYPGGDCYRIAGEAAWVHVHTTEHFGCAAWEPRA